MKYLQDHLDEYGFRVFGYFNAIDSDIEPKFQISRDDTVVIIGNAGSEIWKNFQNSNLKIQNPLDSWTRNTLDQVAKKVEAHPVYPFDQPWPPMQKWAARAHCVFSSPLGILIHPEFGLWHAYRAAFIFSKDQDITKILENHNSTDIAANPCDTCIEKPCLSACPVSAFSETGYDVQTCRDYLASELQENCKDFSCKARLACPIGASYRYDKEHAQFHMKAFA